MNNTSTQNEQLDRPIDMRWLVAFVVLGMALGGVALINGRPVIQLLQRFGVNWSAQKMPDDVRQRYAALAGDRANPIQAIDFGVRLYLSRLDAQPANPQEAQLWQRISAAEPDNAVGSYLHAVRAAIGSENAEARYAAMTASLQEASNRPAARWHVMTARNLWEKAMRAAGMEESLAVTRATLFVGIQRGRALREGGLALCHLSRSLAAENALPQARQCAQHAHRWARLSVESDTSPQIALAAAEVLAEADASLAFMAARDGDLATAAEYRESAENARRFLQVYRRASDGYPVDMFSAGAPKTTRPTAFRMMLRALISVGVMVVATAAAATTLVLALIRWLFTRRRDPEKTELLVRSRFWFLCGATLVVFFPALLGVASLQLLPVHEIFLGSAYWIGATLALVFVASVWAIYGTARWWAGRSTGQSSSAIRVWYGAALVLVLLLVQTMLKQWNFFGPHEAWFDAGFQLDWAVQRYRTWAGSVCVITVLVAVVWFVMAKREFRRADDARRRGLTRLRVATIKAIMMLAGLSFLVGTLGTVLAERSYYRYDRRYRTLMTADLRDEVASRIGPQWRLRYFAPPPSR